MQAWQVNGQGEPGEVMRRVEAELESIRPGELHVEVAASGLGLPDVFMCRGSYPLAPPPPFTPGQEFVGTVCATGEGVSIPVGTRVMGVAAFMIGRGAFATRCTTYEKMVYPAPDTIRDAEAAAFTIAYHTAHIALARRAALRTGETLLVNGGAGGSGCAAIQLGKALGARVIATARGTERLAFCRALGADCLIDYGTGDFTEQVNAASDGRGADVVFDPVGGEVFEASLRCTAPEGRLLPIGFACGRWGQIPTRELAVRNVAVVGAMVGGFARDYMLRMHEELLGLHASGAIRVAIDRQIGFDEIPKGLQALAERRVCGRVVAVHGKAGVARQ